MAVSGQDIGLLFGVLGGGRISGESGTLIKSQLDSIVASLNNATNSKQRRIKLNLDIAGTKSSFSTGLKQITNGLSGQKQFKIKVSEIDATFAINKLKSQLDAMLKTLSVKNGMTITMPLADGGSIVGDAGAQALEEAEVKAAEYAAQLASIKTIGQSVSSAVKGAMTGNGAIAESEALKGVISDYNKWLQKVEELKASKQALHGKALDDLQAEGVAIVKNIERIREEQRAREEASRASETSDDAYARRISRLNALQKSAATALGYTAAKHTEQYRNIEIANAELQEMATNYTRLTDADLDRLSAQINSNTAQIRSMNLASKSFGDTLLANAKKFTSWLGVSRIIMMIYNSLRKMVVAVKDVDTAMTELRKVTNETEASYISFLDKATSRTRELGATISDTVSASADFARLGYSLDDAAMLADAALVYKNVGDGIEDVGTASESIISTMRAFGIEAEGAMFIVDKFNEVGNNFAISSRGVGDALLRSASALAAGNNTLDESIALVTAANSVVQDADKVGTTMKTISMFLRAAKTEAEEAGESTEGMANSVSELRGEILALTGGKVDIQIDEDTFKSTYQIIKELSGVWDELTDISQANILEMIGGKRNSNVVAALLTNFQTAEEVIKTAANASGSALAENEKYLDSINGKVAQFKAAFEELSLNIFDSEMVKGVVDFGTGLLDILNALAKINALLPVTVALVTAIITLRRVNQASAMASSVVYAVTRGLSAESEEVKTLTTAYAALSAVRQKDVIAVVSARLAQQGLTKEEIAAKLATLGLTTATVGQTSANYGLSASFKAVMASNPVGWIMLAISLVPTAINLINEFHKSNEELIQDAKDLKTSYSNTFTSAVDELSTLRGLEDEFKRLSAGVDDYGNNISLAADDYERYREIVSTILGISPSLISGYDAEGNAIANKNGLLEKSIELMEEEQRLKMKEFVSDENLTTVGMGEVAAMEEYESANLPPYGNAKSEFANAFRDAANRYAAEAQGNFAGEIYDALNPGNIGLNDFWTEGYWNQYGVDANRFAQDYYETIVNALRINRSILEDYFTQGEIDKLLDIADEYDKNIEVYNSRIDGLSQALNPTLQYVPQTITAYSELTDGQKEFLTNYVNTFRITADTTEEEILQMKQDILGFTEFIAQNGDIQESIALGMSIEYGVNANGNYLTISDYQEKVKEFTDIINSHETDEQVKIKAAFGIETDASEINPEVEKAIQHVTNLLQDEYDTKISELSVADVLQIYYNISASPDSLTFDDLMAKLLALRQAAEEIPTFANSAAKLESAYGLLSAASDEMSSKGSISTNTLKELIESTDDYVKYLNIENGAIRLNIDAYKKYSEALFNKDISKIKAQIIELENQRNDILFGSRRGVSLVEYEAINDEIEQLILELRLFEGFSTQKIEVRGINALKDALGDTTSGLEHIQNLISELRAGNFDNLTPEDFSGVLSAVPELKTELLEYCEAVESGTTGTKDLAKIIAKLEGAAKDLATTQIAESIDNVAEASSKYSNDSYQTQNAIAQLAKLVPEVKNALYDQATGFYDLGDAAISSADDLFAFIQAVNKLKLIKIEDSLQSISKSITSGSSSIIEYGYQQAIANIKDDMETIDGVWETYNKYTSTSGGGGGSSSTPADTIKESFDSLNSSIEHSISLQQQYFNQAKESLDSDTMRSSLAKQIGYYKQIQLEANKAAEALRAYYRSQGMSAEEIERQSDIQDLSKTWWSAADSIKEAMVAMSEEIVQAFSDSVDAIQNVYDVLHKAANEYAESGYITVDALQEVIGLGVEYLAFLQDENGQLVINEKRIRNVIAARTEQMAVESALAYVEALRSAKYSGDIEELEKLLHATQDATDATWGYVYACLGLAGLSDDQYQAALQNINALRALSESAITSIGQTSSSVSDSLKDMQKGMDDILQYVMDMIKQEVDNQIDALEDLKDSYSELIKLKKESLEATKEEGEYTEQVSELTQKLTKIQNDIDMLDLVGTRESEAQKAALMEEQAELQKELADLQSDYAYNAQVDALDKMEEAYHEEKDKEIKEAENSISSQEKLYQLAIERIQTQWDSLYGQLLDWNYEYGSVLQDELTESWNNCLAAAERYGDYVSAMNSIPGDIDNIGSETGNLSIGNTNYDASYSDDDAIRAIVNQMKSNNAAWHGQSKSVQEYLAGENDRLAAQLSQYGIDVRRERDGVWYLDDGRKLFEVYKYHSGGIVGGGSAKENEQFAILKKKEWVLTDAMAGNLMKNMTILGKIGQVASKLGDIVSSMYRPGLGELARPDNGALSNIFTDNRDARSIQVTIGDTIIQGADSSSVRKHEQITKQFMNDLATQLGVRW